jgi:ABC-type multidrug transport system permease subunit
MRKLLLVAGNDVRLTVRDRAAFFWLLALPVFLTWLFGRMMAGGGAEKVSLTVIDRDGGWLAAAMIEEISVPGVALQVVPKDASSAQDAEKTTRWIELPPGFTEGALAGRQQTLKIETAKDAGADYSRAAEVLVVRAIARALARAAEMKTSGGPMDAATYDRLRARPPLVAVAVSTAGHGTAVPKGVAQSVPGILTFTVLMMTTIYGAVFLTIEKRSGMLRRQFTLPVSRHTLFAGKVLGRMFVAGIQIAILLVTGRFLFHLGFGSSPAALLALLASYAFAVAGIATFLGAILKNPEQASSVGMLVSLVMAAMGGCWWPAEVMPDWLRTAAHIFPTTWAMGAFHALISFGKGFDAVLLPCAVLVGFGAAFSLWGARKLDATSEVS